MGKTAWWEWDSFPFEQPINTFCYKSYTDINIDASSSMQCIIVEYPHTGCDVTVFKEFIV